MNRISHGSSAATLANRRMASVRPATSFARIALSSTSPKGSRPRTPMVTVAGEGARPAATPRTPRSDRGTPPSPGTREADRAATRRGWRGREPGQRAGQQEGEESRISNSEPQDSFRRKMRPSWGMRSCRCSGGPRIGVTLVEEVVDAAERSKRAADAGAKRVRFTTVEEPAPDRPGCAGRSGTSRRAPAVRRLSSNGQAIAALTIWRGRREQLARGAPGSVATRGERPKRP